MYSICSLRFRVRKILKNIKIQTILFHVRFEILCIRYSKYSLASRASSKAKDYVISAEFPTGQI